MNNILYTLLKKYNGNWLKVYEALQTKEKIDDIESIPEEWVTLLDNDYPEFMKGYYKPSFILIKKESDDGVIKWYVPYGKDLKERFEVKNMDHYDENEEKIYVDNLTKYCCKNEQ